MSEFNKSSGRKGSIIILTVFAAIFMLGMTALVTDVGYMYYSQSKLQTAVNAGWKAGYDRMMSLKGSGGQLNPAQESSVIAHIKEVMLQNGFSESDISNLQVNFGANNRLEVICTTNVGLFFARAMDFKSANVTAQRENHGMDTGQGIVPLAIPHGVTKDLSKNFYTCDLFPPDPAGNVGFASGAEYILKLGSGGGNDKTVIPPVPEEGKILVPMDRGAQSEAGFLNAYGVVFWCLRIDAQDPGYVPAEWLLGYRGGSFFLMNNADVIQKLNDYGVNFTVIIGAEEIQAIYDQANPNILDLYDRPKVAVYSSQPTLTPIEEVFQTAKIPYGTYSLPGNWDRRSAYSERYNTRIYDLEVANGALANYQWIHTYNEDFTGFSGGCDYWLNSCKDSLDQGLITGSLSKEKDRLAIREKMCDYCRAYYDAGNNSWITGYDPKPAPDTTNCKNARRRCVDKATYTGVSWAEDSSVTICRHNGIETTQCSNDEYLRATADALGFTSETGSEPKPQFAVYQDGSYPLPDSMAGWFDKATKVQKMKWAVANTIRSHVDNGGFLFAQSFSAETLDLALWQSSIYAGNSPEQAYDNCLAFTNFHYKIFPRSISPKWYSNINTRAGAGAFNLNNSIIPQCQNHGVGFVCDTGEGNTASFDRQQLKADSEILGTLSASSDMVKYLRGERGYGAFSFLGGDYHNNTETKRLILNNLFLGSLVEKKIAGDSNELVVSKQKSNYGPVDPDNINGGGANDYRDRFINGFNQPLQIGDRLITLSGNQRGPTDQAVKARVDGTADLSPNRTIIVPITDVAPEAGDNNPHNADAKTVYDIQGQDHPGGIYDPTQYGFGSSVRIIGFAMFEVLDPSEYTRDGNNYLPGDNGDLGAYQPGQVRGKFIKYIVKPGDVVVN